MQTVSRVLLVLLTIGAALAAGPEPAYAYGGPGSVISGIGALLAVIAAILASIFGFIWFPLKRLFRKMKGEEKEENRKATADRSSS